VLIVDEAHDLHSKTLVGLKRLMEVVADGGRTLAIILAGRPKLRNDLRRPTMEEIGYRSVRFALDDVIEDRQAYVSWLIGACKAKDVGVASIIDDAASRCSPNGCTPPPQIEQHLTLAFEHGFRCGEKPVTADVIETVLARQLDDLEPRLTRHGYSVKNLADQFHAKPAEVRLFLRGALDAERTRELSEQMRRRLAFVNSYDGVTGQAPFDVEARLSELCQIIGHLSDSQYSIRSRAVFSRHDKGLRSHSAVRSAGVDARSPIAIMS
jgi:hypothetical protein